MLDDLRPERAQLRDEVLEEVLASADLVTLARTAVERDSRGDVMDAHAPEVPTRFAKMLGQIVRPRRTTGRRRLGATATTLSVLWDVHEHPGARTSEVTKRVQKPRTTSTASCRSCTS